MKETRFKQTEIGLIPEDWEISYVENECKVETGSKNTQDKKDNGKYPFYVRSEKIERINTYSYDCEAVLTAGDGVGTGKVFHYINGKFEVHQRVYIINEFSNKLNGLFFYLYFSNNFLGRIKTMTAKSSVDSVRKDMINKMQIPLPLLYEQEKIASALTSIDNLLLSLDKLIEKKRLIKQGAMQELLTGKKRLPGFTGEWVERRLGDIGEIIKESINPQLYHTQSFSEYSMPAYDLNKQPEIKYGEEMFSNRTKIYGTVLLYNKLNVRQRRIWYIVNCKHNSICSMEFLPYMVYRDYLKFFYYKLSIDSVVNYFVGISKGTSNSQKRISPNDFLDFKVKYPRELQEQKAIATVLSSIDKEIESLENKKAKYEQIKQGMMQQLLTGKIRLIKKEILYR